MPGIFNALACRERCVGTPRSSEERQDEVLGSNRCCPCLVSLCCCRSTAPVHPSDTHAVPDIFNALACRGRGPGASFSQAAPHYPPPPPPKGEAAARSPEGAACGKAAWQSRPAPAPPANAQLMPPTRTPSQQPGASCHQHEHPGRAELWMLHASMAALHPRWAALPWR